jgi:hypothetical protein
LSVIVPWQGEEYDVDPSELTGLELGLIKQRTGLSFSDLVSGIATFDADALRAVFWVNDRRRDDTINFSDYAGPPMKVFLPYLEVYTTAMEELGKALPDSPAETPGSGGSESSSDSTSTTSAA